MFRFDWGEGASRRWQAHEQGPAACGPAVPTASAFGAVLTSARPTSRGQALCVSFRLGRWCEQTAVLRWCAAKQRDSGGIAVFAEVRRVRHCVCACFSFLSGRKRLLPFLSLAAGFCGKQAPAWMRVFAPASNAEGKVGGNDASLPRGARIQSADKAHKRKNRSDKIEIRGDFCFRRQLHLHPRSLTSM